MEPTPAPGPQGPTSGALRAICLALGSAPLLYLGIALFLQSRGTLAPISQILGPGVAVAGVLLILAGLKVATVPASSPGPAPPPVPISMAAIRRSIVSMALIEGGALLCVMAALLSHRPEFYLGAPLATFLILRQWPGTT